MGVKVVGLGQVLAKANKLRGRLSDPYPMMRDISIRLHQNVITRFVREIDPNNNAWERSARAIATGGQTLTDTGRLRGSVRFGAGKNYAEVYTNTLVYAAPHNYGLIVGRGVKLPRREFIGYGVQDELVVKQIAKAFVKY